MEAGGDREAYFRWRREVISRGEYGKNIHELGGRTIMMQHHPMKDGGWVSTHEDITEQRQQEARIRHLARHDALTELPNRIQFVEEMTESEATIRRRLDVARREWQFKDQYRYDLVNDRIDDTVAEISRLICAEAQGAG